MIIVYMKFFGTGDGGESGFVYVWLVVIEIESEIING